EAPFGHQRIYRTNRLSVVQTPELGCYRNVHIAHGSYYQGQEPYDRVYCVINSHNFSRLEITKHYCVYPARAVQQSCINQERERVPYYLVGWHTELEFPLWLNRGAHYKVYRH